MSFVCNVGFCYRRRQLLYVDGAGCFDLALFVLFGLLVVLCFWVLYKRFEGNGRNLRSVESVLVFV